MIFDAAKLQAVNIVQAHKSPLACLSFNFEGTMMATSSDKASPLNHKHINFFIPSNIIIANAQISTGHSHSSIFSPRRRLALPIQARNIYSPHPFHFLQPGLDATLCIKRYRHCPYIQNGGCTCVWQSGADRIAYDYCSCYW